MGLMDDWQRMRDALAEQGREAARLYGQATEREVANLRRADAAEAALADRDATIARLTAEWERECADGDRVLIGLGFSPETGRTEGGSLHLGRILAKCVTLEHIQQRVIEAEAEIARLRDEWRLEDRRDRVERLLSAVDWAGDLTDWCAGRWVMRPDWRTVILNALLPAPPAAKEADRG